jgi:DNA (cytosine-5)-methyltransferase 1
MTITFGSLFSGIGGFDLGFERAGMRCAWQCEIDAAARGVLARRFPGVPIMEDVRDVHWHKANQAKPKEVLRELAAVDVICAGFP